MQIDNNSEFNILDNPNLEVTGNIDANGYSGFKANKLKKCGNIDAPDAQIFLTPELVESGYLDIRNATIYDIQELKISRYFICANKMPIFGAPELIKSGRICTTSANIFSAPKLETLDNIYAFRAQEFVIKEISGKLYCNNKTEVFGKCGKILRNNNWALINDEVYIVEDIKDGIYKLTNEDRTNFFTAVESRQGELKFTTLSMMIKNMGKPPRCK